VPARIVAVADLPRTRNGKLAESAVRDMIHGRSPSNRHALANPKTLELFRDVQDLRA
jgi:acetoacetyl-CoA synthetase